MKKTQTKKTKDQQLFEAVVDGNQRGFAFLVTEAFDFDFFVPQSKLNGALHRDTVLAKRVVGTVDEAEVVRVIKRGISELVGTFEKTNGGGFVAADEAKFCKDIFVGKENTLNAKHGQKVVAKITMYPSDRSLNPEGKITQVLGFSGEHVADMKAVAVAFGFPLEFTGETLERAKKVPQEVTDISKRLDLRQKTIFTIDGEDAKDLDDAVSIDVDKNGNFVLGVHIADVSEYVKPTDNIDREAFFRGTSVYFPEMVLPMLPVELSNGICSLFEKTDRLTLSVFVTVDKNGAVKDFEFFESVINSCHRMTYTSVEKILKGDKKLCKKYADIVEPLSKMKQLATILIEKRKNQGNIDFSTKEVKFVLSQTGEVEDIVPVERLFSHRLIEEFMILANEAAAEFASSFELPFVFRTHEKPDADKVEVLFALLKNLGFAVKPTREVSQAELQKLLEKAKDTPYFNLVNDVMLRTMQKAKYTEQNIGHFGLSSQVYCHFTSPIRRYPDLTVHRILKTMLRGKMTPKAILAYEEIARDVCPHCSNREKSATEAERKADDIKKCQFAKRLIGQRFLGLISGVVESGIFVMLENTIEGFVSTEKLFQSNLVFDRARFCLSNFAVKYSLGDKVEVEIESVNISACKIDMKLC